MATIWAKIQPWILHILGLIPSVHRILGFIPSVSPQGSMRGSVLEDVQSSPQTVPYDIQSLGKYDIFLNHRGPDVKHTFVAHLNDALCTAGFHPFLDAESLIKGQHAINSINEALTGVHVHVVIFSKRYAESEYCLDELHDILESGKHVIPVLYDVVIEDLCEPHGGRFAEGFHKHKMLGRHQDVIKRWESALKKAANITAFRLVDFNGDEAQLKRRIVNAIQYVLPPLLLQVPRHQVGLQEPLEMVIEKSNLMEDNVGIIGVHGMGGIGKTRLAQEVYNHFVMEKLFEKRSFLTDVRSSNSFNLKRQLVHDLLQKDLQNSEEFSYWFDRCMGQKMFIVIDDIDHKDQFNVLIPNINKLARGSRILVTSRYQSVLKNIMKGDGHLFTIHEVKLLNSSNSHQLFNWHAFYSEKATNGFEELAKEVANACGGLPLALQTIGAFLFDKTKPEHEPCWREAVQALHTQEEILDKLKISYDGLSSDKEKLMFKDLACFLVDKDEQMVMQIFESCNSYNNVTQFTFYKLMDKSLITLDENRKIRMHDLLRDMGRSVVKKESHIEWQQSHLWDVPLAEQMLQKNQGTNLVRGLSVAGAKNSETWKADKYANMNELHFLILDGCKIKGNFSNWSHELRWLQWWDLPLSNLPSSLSLPNLVVLDLTGSKNVIRISPKNSSDEFPSKKLRMLILKDCIALQELPQTLGNLSKLVNLDVQGCLSLQRLPDSFGELKNLQHFDLSSCASLEKIPDTIVKLTKLQTLRMENCTKLKVLPRELGKLSNLRILNVSRCSSLEALPDSLGGLKKLERLSI